MSSNKFVSYLKDLITVKGALPMSSVMRELLINPQFGYYTTRQSDNVLGKKGDFVTSPEITPMFGELLTVHLVDRWEVLGRPHGVQLVELGPGKGTLMADILRNAKSSFREFYGAIERVQLVEVSEGMRASQRESIAPLLRDNVELVHRALVSDVDGGDEQVDNALMIVSHEFYDCLPINVYEKERAAEQWQERLLGYDFDADEFVYVHKPLDKHVQKFFVNDSVLAPPDLSFDRSSIQVGEDELRGALETAAKSAEQDGGVERAKYLELSFDAMAAFEHCAQLMAKHGGAQVLIDYGNLHVNYPSLRYIVEHKLIESADSAFLKEFAGQCDVSVDVHFAPLMAIANKHRINAFLSSQSAFLKRSGIDPLLFGRLAECKEPRTAKRLIQDYRRIVDADQMGSVYKALEMTHDRTQNQKTQKNLIKRI